MPPPSVAALSLERQEVAAVPGTADAVVTAVVATLKRPPGGQSRGAAAWGLGRAAAAGRCGAGC